MSTFAHFKKIVAIAAVVPAIAFTPAIAVFSAGTSAHVVAAVGPVETQPALASGNRCPTCV